MPQDTIERWRRDEIAIAVCITNRLSDAELSRIVAGIRTGVDFLVDAFVDVHVPLSGLDIYVTYMETLGLRINSFSFQFENGEEERCGILSHRWHGLFWVWEQLASYAILAASATPWVNFSKDEVLDFFRRDVDSETTLKTRLGALAWHVVQLFGEEGNGDYNARCYRKILRRYGIESSEQVSEYDLDPLDDEE